jgi:CubicO group peptidase (beta-lactamase class C family)
MRARIPFLLAFLVCVVAVTLPALPPAAPPSQKRLDELLEPIRKKHNLPALAGAVVTTKGAVAVGAVGVRKRGVEVPVTADDQFHIGSDTKAMTATMIARLVETGKLRWESTLGKTFPDVAPTMSPEVRGITLVQLLTHHSGLPANFPGGWGKVPGELPIRRQREYVVRTALAGKLEGKPGEKFLYSNLGYVVAAAMAEKATGVSWEELMAREVFNPLGMRSAGYGPPGRSAKVLQPWPHKEDGAPLKPGPNADNPPVMGPAGRVHCSLPDWARFVADVLKGTRGQPGLLRPRTYQRLLTSPYPDHFYTVGGWGGGDSPRGPVLAHDGSNTFNYASALVVPGQGFAVLAATNQDGPDGAGRKACQEAVEALAGLHRQGR